MEKISINTPVVAISLLILAFISIFAILIRYCRNSARLLLPPGSFGWPLLGETLEILKLVKRNKTHEFFERRMKQHGGAQVIKTCLFGSRTVIFYGAAGNRFLFNNENTLLRNFWPSSVAKLFGKTSLLSKSGNEAKRLRKMLMTFLEPRALQKFVGRADSMVAEHLKNNWIEKEQVQAYHLIKRAIFSVACGLFVSVDDEMQQAELYHHFHDVLRAMIQIPLNLPGTPYRKGRIAGDHIRRILEKIVDRRRKDLANGCSSHDQDLLSYLLCSADEVGNKLTEEEVKDNILLLVMGGHDTSVITVTFLLKYLALNPPCYRQVLQEQMQILGEMEENKKQHLEWEDIQKMKYSWRAAQETMRLQPPAGGAWRKSITDISYDGFIIPRGWKLLWTAHSTHRDGKYFGDSEKYLPSRFEGKGPTPYTFVPFGGRRRGCPRNEYARMIILVFLHNIVKNFEWSLVNVDEEEIGDPLPTPSDGLWIKLIPLLQGGEGI